MHVKLRFPELGSARQNNEEILNAASENVSEIVCLSAVLYRAVIGKTWTKASRRLLKVNKFVTLPVFCDATSRLGFTILNAALDLIT